MAEFDLLELVAMGLCAKSAIENGGAGHGRWWELGDEAKDGFRHVAGALLADQESTRVALANSQMLLVLLQYFGDDPDGGGIMPYEWESEGFSSKIAEQIDQNIAAIDPGRFTPSVPSEERS